MHFEDCLYQKKLHEPLAEAKPANMKAEEWTMLDRQALGAVRLSLAKNVAYNVVNDRNTYDLFKALSNMYEKPSALNKVFLIRQPVNTKMKKGASVADHVNEFNAILTRLMLNSMMKYKIYCYSLRFPRAGHALLQQDKVVWNWCYNHMAGISGVDVNSAQFKTKGISLFGQLTPLVPMVM
nr:retrovirus-related Pol polyprotein from transposon TNT 1-94 [Tanacetum cinerariifolium]